jgi:hypothetical protein
MSRPTPKPGNRRRWLQFRLRTVLVITALVAVACGWFGSRLHKARLQSEAVATLLRHGAKVKYAHEVVGQPLVDFFEREGRFDGESIPTWQRTLLGDEAFKRVVGISLDVGRLSPEYAGAIAHLPELERVHFEAEQRLGAAEYKGAVTDDLLTAIGGLTKLKTLQLEGPSRVSESGLRPLSNLRSLETLILGLMPTPPHVLEPVGGMTALRTLVLFGRGTFDELQFEHLENLVQLEHLTIVGSFDGCRSLIPLGNLPKLKELSIYLARHQAGGNGLCGDIPPDRLRELGSLRNLHTLEIVHGATDADVVWLRHVTGVSELSLEFGTGVTDRSAPVLAQLKNLRMLNLRQTKMGDDGLRQLAVLPKLERLHLDETLVTDRGLAYLKNLPSLRKLELNRANVTSAGVRRLKASLPQLETVGNFSP